MRKLIQKAGNAFWLKTPSFFFLLCVALIVSFFVPNLLLRFPKIWPDESLWAAAASDLVWNGQMRTELLDGAIPGIGQRTYWMPPLYLLLLAFTFKIFGVSITVMRVLSVFLAGILCTLVVFIARKSGMSRMVAAQCVALLLIQHIFIRASFVGRMEIFTLCFLLGSVLITSFWLREKDSSNWRLSIAGFMVGLAYLSHPLGISGIIPLTLSIALHYRGKARWINLAWAMSGIFIAILPWLFYILQDPASFVAQFGLQLARKATLLKVKWNSQLAFNFGELSEIGALPGAFLFLAGIAGLIEIAKRCPTLRGILILQLSLACMVLSTMEMWYPFYLMPLSVLGWVNLLLWLIQQSKLSKLGQRIAIASWGLATVFLWIFNLIPLVKESLLPWKKPELRHAYFTWTKQINNVLPKGARVTINSIPDPYLGLIHRRDLLLRHFSPVPIPPSQYQTYLERSDYIIVSSSPPDQTIENFAIQKGVLLHTIEIPDDKNYSAKIYKMK